MSRLRRDHAWWFAFGVVFTLAMASGCAGDTSVKRRSDAAGDDPFRDSGFTNPDLVPVPDASSLSPDAFFVNDPQPPYSGADGKMLPPSAVSGTRDCPDDKNREGCPCTTPGQKALCWPGKRINRNHGVCRDGMTRCEMGQEFGNRWGACVGYTLPVEAATEGAPAWRKLPNVGFRVVTPAEAVPAQVAAK